MKHFLYSRRPIFAEARVIRFAGGSNVPGAGPDTPPPTTETKVDAQSNAVNIAKHKDVHAEASQRITGLKTELAKLNKGLSAVAKFRDQVVKDRKVDATQAEKLGIEDVNGDKVVDQNDVDVAHTNADAAVKKVEGDMNTALGDKAASIDAIKQTGPAGKIDGALLQLQDAMNGDGSLGETLVAIAEVIKILQDLFKGGDGSGSAKGGPESGKSGPAGEKADVKKMLEDTKKDKPVVDTLTKLAADKTAQLDGPNPPGKRQGLQTARTTLTAKEQLLVGQQADLSRLEGETQKDQGKIDIKKAIVTGTKGEVEVLKAGLRNAEADIKKLEADIKKINQVKTATTESKDKFSASTGAIRAALDSMIGKVTEADVKTDLQSVKTALDAATVGVAANELDLAMTLPVNVIALQKSFFDQGVTNTADFGIDPDTKKVGNPDAFLKGVQQLIQKATPKPKAPVAPHT